MTFEMHDSKAKRSSEFIEETFNFHQLSCANCGTALAPDSGEQDLPCSYCGQRHKFLKPPEVQEPVRFHAGDKVAVEWGGHWWSAHVVEEVEPEQQWHIHFEGWAPAFDDVVDLQRIRPIDYDPGDSIIPPPYEVEPLSPARPNRILTAGIVAALILGIGFSVYQIVSHPADSSPTTDHSQPPDNNMAAFGVVQGPVSPHQVTALTPVKAGQKFHVLWDNNWYVGTAMHVDTNGEIIIRYDDFGEEYDEVVPRNRLRLIK